MVYFVCTYIYIYIYIYTHIPHVGVNQFQTFLSKTYKDREYLKRAKDRDTGSNDNDKLRLDGSFSCGFEVKQFWQPINNCVIYSVGKV